MEATLVLTGAWVGEGLKVPQELGREVVVEVLELGVLRGPRDLRGRWHGDHYVCALVLLCYFE